MKTSKEFFERMQSDESFAKEIGEKVKAKAAAGEEDYKEIWIPIAAEYGHELTGEELDELREAVTADISEEELGKIAGGTSIICVVAIPVITLGSAVTAYLTIESRDYDKF